MEYRITLRAIDRKVTSWEIGRGKNKKQPMLPRLEEATDGVI